MTLTVQRWARISDLRMEFKNSKLLKRLVSAFNAVKTEQTHWNRACSMIGSGVSLLTEGSLNHCALRLGWQPTWMTESQNNTRRANVPATEHEAMRAFVRPINRNGEASGVPVPRFREAAADQGGSSNPSARAVDEGGSPSPPANRSHISRGPDGGVSCMQIIVLELHLLLQQCLHLLVLSLQQSPHLTC